LNRTVVIQSCSEQQRAAWQGDCIRSVETWAARQGHDYRFIGDAIFDLVPPWYRAKVADKLPVATDFARLVLLRQALDEGYAQALWCDADLLVFDPALRIDFAGSCAFSHEVWIQRRNGVLEVRRNVSNALCVFRRGCVVLPFLLHAVEALVRRVDPAHIAPQFVGPKLLNALQPLGDFALLPQVGALSPEVVKELCTEEGEALSLLRARSSHVLQAANLCASLLGNEEAALVTARLLQHGRV